MGEIKSTLELVMEKTKHLTLSEEEKRARRLEIFQTKVKGLVHKYCENLITENQLETEFSRLKTEGAEFVADLPGILSGSIPINDKGLKVAMVAGKVFQLNLDGLEIAFQEFNASLREQRKLLQKNYLQQLQDRLNLSGSALETNVEKLEQWISFKHGLEERLRKSIFKGNRTKSCECVRN